MGEYHYPRSTCTWCEERIELIPVGDGLWTHGYDLLNRNALCDKGHRVDAGILRTANPGANRIIRHPEDVKAQADHHQSLVSNGVEFVKDLVAGMDNRLQETIVFNIADELYDLDWTS